MSIKQPVFLVGSERSGTTLLRLMLDAHSQIAFNGEFDYALAALEYENPAEYHQYLQYDRMFNQSGFVIDKSLNCRQLVDSFLRQKQSTKKYIGATVHHDFAKLIQLYPDARFIHIVRDPRDVANSVVKMGWAGHVYYGCQRWLDAEAQWDNLQPALTSEQYIEISYEQLILNTKTTLTDIVEFLGTEYEKQMLDYPKYTSYKLPNPELVFQWLDKFDSREIAIIETRIGKDKLRERDYPWCHDHLMEFTQLDLWWFAIVNKLKMTQFRLQRFGGFLLGKYWLSRRLKLIKWQQQLKLQIHKIENQYLA
jgi:hypothetical protein